MLRWPAFPYDFTVRISLWVSVLVVTALFGWGAWQRRWIADDGLIVLRTVRNLLAGNGPVFNQGERVEANTSTVWTYLVTLGGWLAGPVRLEYVALTLALVLSVAGLVFAMLGTARLYAPSLRGRRALLLPAGVLVYAALPPARDFATSGLENGLVLAYLGLFWWMMVCWSQAPRINPPPGLSPHDATSRRFDGALAFVAGLSVLVRPELALIGGLGLVMMLVAASGWRRRLLIVIAGGLLPVGYQIFRMGYYGLLVPGTAVAKDASGSKWAQGFVYLTNFNGPYLLWVPLVLLVGLALLLLAVRGLLWGTRPRPPRNQGRWARIAQSPNTIVFFMLVSGLLQALYWIRQGGDFMHGRVLLTPVFCLLLPVAVIPIVLPQNARATRGPGYLLAGATGVIWLAVIGWAAVGGELAWAGRRRDPRHVLRNRRRATVLRAGHRACSSAHRCRLPRLSAHARSADRHQQHSRRRAAAPVGQLRPVGRGARDSAAARCAATARRAEGSAHRVLHQHGHARHERRAERPRHRPDRAGQPVGHAHGPAGGRQDRARQEPLPGLGGGRGSVPQGELRTSRSTSTRTGSPRPRRRSSVRRPRPCSRRYAASWARAASCRTW